MMKHRPYDGEERGEMTGWRVAPKRRQSLAYYAYLALLALFILGVVGGEAFIAVHFLRKFW